MVLPSSLGDQPRSAEGLVIRGWSDWEGLKCLCSLVQCLEFLAVASVCGQVVRLIGCMELPPSRFGAGVLLTRWYAGHVVRSIIWQWVQNQLCQSLWSHGNI